MFRHHHNLLQIITSATESLLIRNPSIGNDPRYYLFNIIRENFANNIALLSGYDFRQDRLKFIAFRRNLRISFEAFLDLINLGHDFNINRYQDKQYEGSYLSVLYYNHTKDNCSLRKQLETEGYLGVTPYKGRYTIQSKAAIFNATKHSFKTPEGIDVATYISKICNEVLHPDIFMEISNNADDKREMLDIILRIDLMLLYQSYLELCVALNSKHYLRCNIGCPEKCAYCMEQMYERCRSAITYIVQQI